MKVDRKSSCEYYYGQQDASLWWNLPYHEALEKKLVLSQRVVDELCEEHFLARDAERINRIMKVQRDLQKQLGDKPKRVRKP